VHKMKVVRSEYPSIAAPFEPTCFVRNCLSC